MRSMAMGLGNLRVSGWARVFVLLTSAILAVGGLVRRRSQSVEEKKAQRKKTDQLLKRADAP